MNTTKSSLKGMGCQALLPGTGQAANAVLAQPQRRVVVLTVELCTLHFQQGRTSNNRPGSALFADGALAAAIAYGDGGWPDLVCLTA
jgi:predicted naringenin-chalcone synthase